jgi:hypothetical protein
MVCQTCGHYKSYGEYALLHTGRSQVCETSIDKRRIPHNQSNKCHLETCRKLKITTIHAPVGVALLRLKNEIVRLKNEIYFYFLIMSTSLITSTFALITSTYAKNRKKSYILYLIL